MREFKITKEQLPDDFVLGFCKAEVLGHGQFYNDDITLYIHNIPEDIFNKLIHELFIRCQTSGQGKFRWFNLKDTAVFELISRSKKI